MNIFVKATLIVIIIPFLLISYFNHPSTDDFCYANKVLELGFWNTQIFWYLNWSGRYFGTAANSLYAVIVGLFGEDNYTTNFWILYKFVAPFLFGMFWISLFCFFKAIAGKISSNWNLFWATCLGFVIYLCGMPSTVEGFYWLNGAFYYTLGNIFLFFLLSLLLSKERILNSKSWFRKIIYGLGCALLAAAIAGSSEILAIVLLTIALIGVLLTSYTKHHSCLIWRIVLGVAIISIALSFLSPGTSQRYYVTVEQEQVDYSFKLMLGITIQFIRTLNFWILNPVLLSTSIIFIPIAILLAKQYRIPQIIGYKKFLIIGYIVIWMSLVAITFFMPYISADYLPGRVLNTSYFIFLMGWFLGIFILIKSLGERQSETIIVPKYLTISAWVVMIMGLLFDSHFGQAIYDLLVNAPRYHSELQNRYESIAKNIAENEKSFRVPALNKRIPKTIYLDDITLNPNHWSNECYAKFFNLDSIAITNKR
ncbi:hypothetical protein NIES593_10950 [Hydrococcus rivularis NIES-593]|uniref:Glycosyltransferase RgtA/B/C/D-like domain-containing protein n=1 Tax=Hydrococcus rivularis NIES-593 TaxID=1921803 RepID=A0A1U7HHG8_9CYAN|nr:DUF6056 family protein [Hydrococcus rivularis]OKH22978.1 hypothetical protein NIES593_10950 [Hydrococcus rivularis NIES-593]